MKKKCQCISHLKLEYQGQMANYGKAIAECLKLKHDREHKDRYPTTWGTKTDCGLALTVLRILSEKAI
jgi:hypothetical protein